MWGRVTLLSVAEESAYSMVSEATVDQTNAIQKIMDGIYMHNRQHASVISSICSLFIELSHYGKIPFTSYALVDLITQHLRVDFRTKSTVGVTLRQRRSVAYVVCYFRDVYPFIYFIIAMYVHHLGLYFILFCRFLISKLM